jgi:hypothetical protein
MRRTKTAKSAFKKENSMRIFKAAALYFLAVFAVGFALGIVRVLWAAPRFGERAAELAEMPLMLAAIFAAAGWVVRRFAIPHAPSASIGVGLIALGFLLSAELTVVLGLRGLTFSEYVSTRDPVSGAAYFLMLVVFAVMPWLVARRRSNPNAEPEPLFARYHVTTPRDHHLH